MAAPSPITHPSPDPSRVSSLVIQTSFLGDVVLTTPLLVSLAREGPVDVIATRAGAGLLAGHPAVRDVIVYDKRGSDSGIRGFAGLVRRIRRREDGSPRGAATAYFAQGSMRSAALAAAARVPRRIGFDTSSGRALYTERVAYREDRHHSERLWSLAHPSISEFPEEARRPSLSIRDSDTAAVDALLGEHDLTPGEPLLALAPGSAWATKRWPYYPALGALVSSSVRVVLIGSPEERQLSEEVDAAVRDAGGMPAVNAVGRLSLLASAELIRRCRTLVSNDSLPQHLASAVGTPTITIFGPTVPEFGFGPLAPGSHAVGVNDLPCRPCDRHGPRVCPLGHWRCMRSLEPEAILNVLRTHFPSLTPNR